MYVRMYGCMDAYCIGTQFLHPTSKAVCISPLCKVFLIRNNDCNKRSLRQRAGY